MKTLYIECRMGVAGDMLTAALYELLDDAQKQQFLAQMNTIFEQDIRLFASIKTASGITGTHMHVHVLGKEEQAGDAPCGHDSEHSHEHESGHTHEHGHTDSEHTHGHTHEHDHDHAKDHAGTHGHTHDSEHSHTYSSYPDILDRISSLALPDDVRRHAAAVYRLIGEAEAKVHNTELTHIHFHEVGSVDALADVVANSLLISMLAPEQIIVSPIHVGNGSVRCAHGILPVPAPATAELLKGIPFYTGDIDSELCTPTGAALVKHFADRFGSMPAMEVNRIGVGHGTKEFERLNAVRVFSGETFSEKENGADSDRIADISCNLDDMTGEALGFCMETLLEEGALDVYYVPVQMKKNRPGILLHCLCGEDDLERFCGLVMRHTTTRGVRYQYFDRKKLTSHCETRETPYGSIRRKISEDGSVARAKYEFEDLKRIARQEHLSLYELAEKLKDVR